MAILEDLGKLSIITLIFSNEGIAINISLKKLISIDQIWLCAELKLKCMSIRGEEQI